MRVSKVPVIVTFAIAFFFASGLLFAQTSQVAQISGRIADSSGAVIPAAQVTITNVNTGAARTVSSASDGTYTITNLPVGAYRLKVVKTGFQTYVQSGIELQINANPTVNVTLQVGAVSQQVTVVANASQVETQNVGIGQTISQARVVDLPLNGRNVTQLVTLSGAAVNYKTSSAGQSLISNKNYPSSSAFNVAGGQGGQTLFVLDGSPNMDLLSNVGLPMPFPDALQEFRVQTNALPANYGGEPGGVVNVVTKSGTNQFHGDVFEFLRNYNMNARNYFAQTRNTLKRNQFGGVIGGPIVKNKLFFFAGYQGTRESSAPSSNTAFTATKAMLSGDFSAFTPSAANPHVSADGCRGVQLNPTYFNSNDVLLPGYSLNSVALKVLSLIPTATNPCGQIQFGIPNQDHENQIIGRIDFDQNAKQTWFGRYFITDYEHAPTYSNNLLTISTDPSAGLGDRVQSFVLGQTYIINSNTVSSFRASFVRSSTTRKIPSNYPTATSLGSQVTEQAHNFMFMLVGGFFTAACADCNPGPWDSNTFQVSENVNWIHGRQQLSMGGQWNHVHLNGHGTFQSNGDFFFFGQATGLALADFELGFVNHYLQSTGQFLHEGLNLPSLYIQDNIHLTRGLSINPGLRWAPFLMPYNTDHEASIFNMNWYTQGVHSHHFVNAPDGTLFYGDPGMPGASYGFGTIANFSPRIGIVYNPGGKGVMSIRAGFGIFDASVPLFEQVGTHAPWAHPVSFNPYPLGNLTDPFTGYPGGNPFPLQLPIPSNVTFPDFGGGLGSFPLHPKPTYMEQWNLSIQRQLPHSWMVSATYLGNRTLHLEYGQVLNPVIYIPGNCSAGQYGLTKPGPCSTTGNENYRLKLYLADPVKARAYSGVTNFGNGANANYNGLLISAQHRFTHGYTILANYTWSHCLTESEIGLNGAGTPQEYFNLQGDYGNCSWDRRQLFNFSAVANMPSFHTRWMNRVFSHWQLAPIFTAYTGAHVTITDGVDNSLTGATVRPNLIGNPNVAHPSINEWFNNTTAFALAGPGNYGNVGTGTITGPGAWNVDMALSRFFPITEQKQIAVRVEAFNLMNHTRLDNPNGTLTSPTFGRILSAQDPRIMQIAFKYVF